jgi:hypothetical protein
MNSFTLSKLPSIYNNKTVLNEFITDNRLNSLIQHNIGIEFSADNFHRKAHGFICEKAHNEVMLGKFNKKEGCYKIKLENNKHGWGRIKAQDHATLSVMHRPTRHSLCYGTYIDIDIHSCCQTIYLNIIKNNGIENEFPRLKEYVENRDNLLVHYQNKYGRNRDTIKNLFTMIGFGGSSNKWFKTKNINNDNDVFIIELNQEYYKLSRIIYDANPQIINDILKAEPSRFNHKTTPSELLNSKMRTTIAIFYQSCERYCQEAAISFLCSNKGFNLKNIVPCQDGFMILKDLMYPEICDDCEKVIKNKFNFDLKFVVKEFDERFDIPRLLTDKEQQLILKQQQQELKEKQREAKQLLEQQQQELKEKQRLAKQKQADETLNTIEMMEQVKQEHYKHLHEMEELNLSVIQERVKEFETNHIKIINKGLYLIEYPDKNIAKSKKQLLESYEHLEAVVVNKKPQSFVNYWTCNNPEIRCKDDMDVYPDDSKCPGNIYNLWKPFAGELMTSCEKNENAIKFFKKHILILCNKDKTVADYFEKWIGQMIQYPDVKTNCPIFISKEGAGKGTLLTLIRKMIGESKYFETTNPSRDVWGNFNSFMSDSFLVNLNELSKKDTMDSMGFIKGLITDGALAINPKGLTPYKIQSYHRWIITTNNDDPMPTKSDDRRFWIVRSSDELCGDKEYFKQCYNYLNDPDVIKTMYDYFKSIQNLENFNKLEKPITDYQRNIQDGNISPVEMWLKQFVIDHEDHEIVEALGSITFNKFNNWKEANKVKFEVSSAKLGVMLSNLNIPGIEKGRHTNKGDTKYYNIKLLKKHFNIGCLIYLEDKKLKSSELEDEEPQYN